MALAPILILGGKRIANLDELRVTDDFEKLQIAAEHGRLLNWLRFHHYNDIATDVESLSENKDNPSFFEDVCYVLGIQCPKEYSAVGKKMPSAVEYETELLPLMRKILVNMIAAYSSRNSNPANVSLDSERDGDNPDDGAIIPSRNETLIVDFPRDTLKTEKPQLYSQSIEDLNLSWRAKEHLRRSDIKTIGGLCAQKYYLLRERCDIPLHILDEIENKLGVFGLKFGMSDNDMRSLFLITMPQYGISEESVLLSSWRVKEGDEIKIGQTIFEIETGKSCFEVPARHSCILRKKLTPSGEEVKVGTPVAIIEII